MNPNQMMAWMQIAQIVTATGISIVGGIRNLIKSSHPDATDEDLNAILRNVVERANEHKRIADMDILPEGQKPSGSIPSSSALHKNEEP